MLVEHAIAEKIDASTTSTGSAPKKFQKRKRTPSEELSDGREAAFLRQEQEELERDRRVDGEWRASSRRRKVEVAQGEVEVVERRRSSRRWVSGRAGGGSGG